MLQGTLFFSSLSNLLIELSLLMEGFMQSCPFPLYLCLSAVLLGQFHSNQVVMQSITNLWAMTMQVIVRTSDAASSLLITDSDTHTVQ